MANKKINELDAIASIADADSFAVVDASDSDATKKATALQIKNYNSALANSQIFVGNASNIAGAVAPSGGATISNTGIITLGPNHGYATTATAGATTTLVATSAVLQLFTGATSQTIVLPVASTLVLGWKIRIVNLSTGSLTVNSSGSDLVVTVAPLTTVEITCILTSGTDAASWFVDFTDARIINRLLGGFTSGAGIVSASDSILSAIQKIYANSLKTTTTEWVSPSTSWVSNVTWLGNIVEFGLPGQSGLKYFELQGSVTGAVTAAALTITLPFSWTLANSFQNGQQFISGGHMLDSGTQDYTNMAVLKSSSTAVGVSYTGLAGSSSIVGPVTQSAPFTWANNDRFWLKFFTNITAP